ncbi:MAG: nitroreductase family protein [Oscillospiraceae bacterium]|nr:nitroreductase family protein [Oscillospiraceae bacterium]
MDQMELMRTRRSVRTFDDTPLRAEDAQRLLDFAAQADSPYHIPISWHLLDARRDGLSSPVIAGTETWLAGKLPRVPHAEEAFGYTLEQVVLYAASLGIGTTWIAGTMNRPAFEQAIGLAEGEAMPCVTPLGYPAKRMSLRETLMRKGVKADTRLDFGALFFDGSFDAPLTPEGAGALEPLLSVVRLAPSAVNKQPWRAVVTEKAVHFYERRDKGYVGADGWDLQKVDLGIALCHFALAAQASGIETTLILDDPGLPTGQDTGYIASYVLL